MRQMKWVFTAILGAVVLLSSCGGGGGEQTVTPPIGTPQGTEAGQLAFSVVLTAEPDQGPSPLVVSFSAYAFGGKAPYTYEWDFNGDGVVDSTEVNPFYTFTSTTVITLRVTDADGEIVQVQRTITITAGEEPSVTEPLTVRFTVEPTVGVAPLDVVFEAIVTGGTPPYQYVWDLDGDGTPDSFSRKVVWRYEAPGNPTTVDGGATEYYYQPSLTVTDNRGVQRSTLDDADNDGQPDWLVLVNVTPPATLSPSIRVNPVTGQAPLSVDFVAGASGGEPPYLFKWDFGDGFGTDWLDYSVTNHTYMNPGVYYVRVTVKDNQGVESTSGAVQIVVKQEPTFKVTISASVESGPVPLRVDMDASAVGGKEPITYTWQVFTDLSGGIGEPVIVLPPDVPTPYLDSSAVVVPDSSNDPSPTFVFGSWVDTDGNVDRGAVSLPFAIRLVATDANGVQAFSNLVRITPTAPEPRELYLAGKFPKVGDANYSLGWSNSFTPRANVAEASHPSGVVFLFGGERLSDTGEFLGLVDFTDAAWALNITGEDIGTPDTGIGMGYPGGYGYRDGGWTQLNVIAGPPYPAFPVFGLPPSIKVPSQTIRADRILQKTDRFVNRGSAAAALVHEHVNLNPLMSFSGIPPDGGLGVPVIYVFGGRDATGQPLDVVQKYYPPGFGTEDLPVEWDNNGDGTWDSQITNQMTDIWSNRFQFIDWDLHPQEGDNPWPPIVPDRPPMDTGGGTQGAVPLNPMPDPLYGHEAVTVEFTDANLNPPVWPEGTYHYIFILGGITDRGQGLEVVPTMRWFNTAAPPAQRQEGQEPGPGDYSLMPDMPIERAYFRAFAIPGDEFQNIPWQIIVIGGFDRNGNYVSQIDRFTFDSVKNPNSGYWETIGYLPEAAAGTGAGWEFDERGFVYHQFAGRTIDGFTGSVFDILESGSVSYAPHTLIPRGWFASAQAGSNTYYIIGGLTEQGMTAIVERYQP